jgi:hypothetical protein
MLVILIHMTSEYGNHNEFRNVASKLASHIVQKLKKLKDKLQSNVKLEVCDTTKGKNRYCNRQKHLRMSQIHSQLRNYILSLFQHEMLYFCPNR